MEKLNVIGMIIGGLSDSDGAYFKIKLKSESGIDSDVIISDHGAATLWCALNCIAPDRGWTDNPVEPG